MVTQLVQNSVPGFCDPKASTSNHHIMWFKESKTGNNADVH